MLKLCGCCWFSNRYTYIHTMGSVPGTAVFISLAEKRLQNYYIEAVCLSVCLSAMDKSG